MIQRSRRRCCRCSSTRRSLLQCSAVPPDLRFTQQMTTHRRAARQRLPLVLCMLMLCFACSGSCVRAAAAQVDADTPVSPPQPSASSTPTIGTDNTAPAPSIPVVDADAAAPAADALAADAAPAAAASAATSAAPPVPRKATRAPAPVTPLLNITHLLHASQFPDDCASRRLLVVDPRLLSVRSAARFLPLRLAQQADAPREDSLDLGAIQLRLAAALAEAFHSNRTLVFARASRVGEAPGYNVSADGNRTEWEVQHVVSGLMRQCALLQARGTRRVVSTAEAGLARLQLHHSCWFRPLSSCTLEAHATAAERQALQDEPFAPASAQAHASRLKWSSLSASHLALWSVPPALRTREQVRAAREQLLQAPLERWSAALAAFVSRPSALLRAHVRLYRRRTVEQSGLVQLRAHSIHPRLMGVFIRAPPLPFGALQTDPVTTPLQWWRVYMRVLEQIVTRQSRGDRGLVRAEHVWVSTWDQRVNDLIERWSDGERAAHGVLNATHLILSQLRDAADAALEEHEALGLPVTDAGGRTLHGEERARTLDQSSLDRLNLAALHALEDACVIAHTHMFVASVAHAHAVWAQLLRAGMSGATPALFLHTRTASAEGFLPGGQAHPPFERDHAEKPTRTRTDAERWTAVVDDARKAAALAPAAAPVAAAAAPPSPTGWVDQSTMLPQLDPSLLDALLPLWNAPVNASVAAPPSQRHDEL